MRPGDVVGVTLYWQGLLRMDANYNISVQFVDAAQRKAAQYDGWPLDGAAPTSSWEPDQVLVDRIPLAVNPDGSPGIYTVRVVVYALEDGKIEHLPTVPAGGQMQASHVVLTTVKVVE